MYEILNRTSGKPFGIDHTNLTGDGAHVQQWTDDGSLDQQWRLVDAGGGYFNLINVNSSKGLDDTGGSLQNGNLMQQYTINGTGNSNQQLANHIHRERLLHDHQPHQRPRPRPHQRKPQRRQ